MSTCVYQPHLSGMIDYTLLTPARTHSISGLQSRALKLTFLALKIQRYQFSNTGQIFWHWAAATLKGLGEFQNKVLDHFLPLFLSKKCQFQDSRS